MKTTTIGLDEKAWQWLKDKQRNADHNHTTFSFSQWVRDKIHAELDIKGRQNAEDERNAKMRRNYLDSWGNK